MITYPFLQHSAFRFSYPLIVKETPGKYFRNIDNGSDMGQLIKDMKV